ncbi:MAG: metallophosphoesterase family protein [Aestuariivita sp.]|uniref:metallophosphoesterase family protein n=1 Tax=Aestuariivita sp. TaxID=1872407 RepID=UPI003BB01DCE
MIRSWLTRKKRPNAQFDPVAPETPILAVGDIHGRADLVERLLRTAPDVPMIFVGDYIDRGEHSADVLRLLHERPDITCLSGNHEEMMMAFISNPQDSGPRWLRFGGLQTLASFGVAGVSESTTGKALTRARNDLVDAMGQDLLAWMNRMPMYWRSGNVCIVHAGADPSLPPEEQSARHLHWGHPDFKKTPRSDGLWVVHGHTIVDEAHEEQGRIAIDTGAYATGRLTSALIGNGHFEFELV